jgi:hypothetical protein
MSPVFTYFYPRSGLWWTSFGAVPVRVNGREHRGKYSDPMAKAPKTRSRTVTWATVRDLALALPGVEESTSYRTPAMKVRGKLIARLKEDGETIVVPMPIAERDVRIAAEPDVFFVTEHYVPWPYVLIRLAAVKRSELQELLHDAWRMVGG